MITLNMTLVATLLVMILAVVLGVWMARQAHVDTVLRRLLDAGQTIPAFVYLIPVLALFGPTRFTAIVAAVIYAAPAAIKLVPDGVKGVPETTIEASRSTGTKAWQEITQVQLPMAKGSLVLATNQGLLYVLAMVVIGGLVGAGALGYDTVLGFSRSEEWGKGAAAGITIVLLGIMVDRIAKAAAERPYDGPEHGDPHKRQWWPRPVTHEPTNQSTPPRGRGSDNQFRRQDEVDSQKDGRAVAPWQPRRSFSLDVAAGAPSTTRPRRTRPTRPARATAASSTSRSTRGWATRRTPPVVAYVAQHNLGCTVNKKTSRRRSPGRASAPARSTRSWRTGATPTW